MKILHLSLIIFITLYLEAGSAAGAAAADSSAEARSVENPSVAEMIEGEIRKIDKENKKITIKHGEMKTLEMPPMTMVFKVNDPEILSKVKTGDKVKFRAEKSGGAFVVTEIMTGI